MKYKKRMIAGVIFLIVTIMGFSYFTGLFRSAPTLHSIEIPKQFSLVVPPNSNFRQGPNQCGPYAAAIFLSTFKPTADIQPERAVEQLPWKLPLGYTHPHALEQLIQEKIVDLETQAYNVGSLGHEEKILFLQQKISSGFPVILLTYMYGYQHYITLLGYDANQEEFYVYDPVFTRGEAGMTLDENGELPGNRNITNEILLSDWSKGGIAGFYAWYLLGIAQ